MYSEKHFFYFCNPILKLATVMATKILIILKSSMFSFLYVLRIPTSSESLEQIKEMNNNTVNGFSRDADKIHSDFDNIFYDMKKSIKNKVNEYELC